MHKTETPPEIAALEEEIARLRGDLLTLGRRIAHDLRAPLSAIGIACAALAEGGLDCEAGGTALPRSITDSVDEIAALIERVSFVAKATAEPAARQKIAMEDVVWSAQQRLERRIRKKGAPVAHPTSWPEVTGVASWIEIVWTNLIANALQFGGNPPRVEIGWSPGVDEFIFWVDDQGPGVPEKQVATLFEPFERLHRMNAPRGLGLPIVQRLVSLQGGHCGYTPRPGGGSRFFFTLPS